MTSTEEMSRDAALCLAITNKAIAAGIEIGIKKAVEYLETEKQKERKGRYDRRLHNTELLLKKYLVLKRHAEGAVFSSNKAKENAIDILDSLDDRVMSDGIYINSIKQSQQRTLIILRHVEKMLDIYEGICRLDGSAVAMRRYNTVYARYISPQRLTVREIADSPDYNGDERAVYKDLTAARTTLSCLIFGIDSLKIS